MIMGTIFAGWWGWQCGPWMAILGGVVGGMLGGLLHALATTTFGVNHIVSGFAINIIAPGVARFMAELLFVNEAAQASRADRSRNSPGVERRPSAAFTLPFLSGGDLFGWQSPDPLGWLEDKEWFADLRHRRVAQGADDRADPRHHPRRRWSSSSPGTCCGARRSASGCARPVRSPTRRRLARRLRGTDALHTA